MIVKDAQGKDVAISPKTAIHGKGWGGGVYYRTKSGKWKFNNGINVKASIDVYMSDDINPESKLPWGVNPDTIVEVEA